MKKVIFILLLTIIISTAAFANHPSGWGVGVMGQFGYGWGYGVGGLGGGMLSLKAPNVPIYWAVNVNFRPSYFGIGATADYYLIDQYLSDFGGPTLGWYLGIGGFFGYGSYRAGTWIDPDGGSSEPRWTSWTLGARLPIGLSFQIPISTIKIEIFGALVPNLGIGFWTWDSRYDRYWGDENRSNFGPVGGVGGELGLRFWF